ncbi:hypothetical protein HK098_004169 [Nowakowskiella sp. JEL0407]|nr:hypothetical protein HK098_004169 [Nowakowskiella sp. JEL0407]
MIQTPLCLLILFSFCFFTVFAEDPISFTASTGSPDYLQCKDPNVLALTFDDGPDAKLTPPLLDTLKTLNVPVTFFVLGQLAQQNPTIIKRAFDEGHQISSHTWDHPNLTTLAGDAIRSQLTQTETVLKGIIGLTTVLMRPPYGEINVNVMNEIHTLGYSAIVWNLDTNDWEKKDPIVAFQADLKAGSGYISLQHDIQEPSVTPAKITEIVTLAKSRGFRFSTVAECIGRQPYKEGWGNLRPAAATTALATPTGTVQTMESAAPARSTVMAGLQQGSLKSGAGAGANAHTGIIIVMIIFSFFN